MSLPKPFYQDKWVTIYHGDCREILSQLDTKVDLVLTDPPFPDVSYNIGYRISNIDGIKYKRCRQLIFWSARLEFPLDYTAIHIWDKLQGCVAEYERIFERYGYRACRIFRYNSTNSPVSARYAGDIFYNHPSQKPYKLIDALLNYASKMNDLILDPFLGSGTTAYCAKKLNRRCIGIEIEERYAEIAAKRCSQSVMELGI